MVRAGTLANHIRTKLSIADRLAAVTTSFNVFSFGGFILLNRTRELLSDEPLGHAMEPCQGFVLLGYHPAGRPIEERLPKMQEDQLAEDECAARIQLDGLQHSAFECE